MRIIFLLLLLPVFSAGQVNDSTFHLIAGFEIKKPIRDIRIQHDASGEYIRDSLRRVNNHFEYMTKLEKDGIATLTIRHIDLSENEIRILMEPGKMILTASDSLSNFTVIGSKRQKDYGALIKELQPFQRAKNKLLFAAGISQLRKDSVLTKKLEADILRLDTTMQRDAYRRFITSHSNSPAVLIALMEFTADGYNPYEVERLFSSLSASVQNSPQGIKWKKKIEKAKATAIGVIAPDFSLPGVDGKEISLSSFRGKYVLLDFWASWCIPCRKENPFLVKAYQAYNKKGFEIFSVSFDDKSFRKIWLKAIEKDGLNWTNASDLKGWDNNVVADLYQVVSIPSNVLIDPNGKIIAKNLRGEELQQKLAELFK